MHRLESSQEGIEVMQRVVHSCLENRQLQKELRGDRKLFRKLFRMVANGDETFI